MKKTKEKKGKGRPSNFKPEYNQLALNYCLLGATDKDLARYFDTNEKTINDWKRKFPDFSKSLKEGKENADANVANRLYQRAMGYSHPEVNIAVYRGKVIMTPITKHYAPDTTACIFWLKNRNQANWRDRIAEGMDDETTPPPTKVEIIMVDARKKNDNRED